MELNHYILQQLNDQSRTKRWLAEALDLSYSTLHQKLSHDTFTAYELLTMSKLLNFSLDDFQAFSEPSEGLKQMSALPIEKRPNIGVSEMEAYEHGGLCVESTHQNGALVYVPYGIWVNVFEAMQVGANALRSEMSTLEQELQDVKEKPDPATWEPIVRIMEERLQKLMQNQAILEQISPLVSEV